jgi:hypothetical protein
MIRLKMIMAVILTQTYQAMYRANAIVQQQFADTWPSFYFAEWRAK